jgi:spore coat protein H
MTNVRRTPDILPAIWILAAVWLTGCEPTVVATPPSAAHVPSSEVAQAPQPKTPAIKPKPPPKPDASIEFFEKGRIPQLKIQISAEDMQKLRGEPRKYVPCSFVEDGKTTFKKVSIKVKGAAGSFRGVDDRPALTVNMKSEKTGSKELYHGLDKFHLNNSVQDESFLCELLCARLCREAGCPAARVTHARVWLNDRDLGLYVLKEGFDKTFLARHFKDPKGNLYDGGFLTEIDQPLERDEGEGPEDRADLKALVAACREGDPAKRWAQISEKLDVPAFLSFTALELMTCHWDGYVQVRNNYRVYFRPEDGRAVFMPHGMDQMFADPGFSVFHDPPALVASAVLQNPQWRAQYREQVKTLLPLFAPARLNAQIDAAHARLRPVLVAMGEDRARYHDERVKDMKNRVATRAQNIRNQMKSGPAGPLVFGSEGVAKVEEWEARPEGDAQLEEQEVEGKACYVLQPGPSRTCLASWRRKVLLTKGSYRLEALAKTKDVVPLADGRGQGFGLRLSGGMRENRLTGTSKWEKLSHSFEIVEDSREVELVAELRSTAGSAIVEAASLKIVKVK